ncbi:MAG: hypothetical protein QM736_09300 [Vicinamibacterales bacterium]
MTHRVHAHAAPRVHAAILFVAGALTLALSTAGCTAGLADSAYFGKVEPPQGQEMRYISGSEPESLDPPVSSSQPDARIMMAIFDGLTEVRSEERPADPGARDVVGAERRQLGLHLPSAGRALVGRHANHGRRLRLLHPARPRARARVAHRLHGVRHLERAGVQRGSRVRARSRNRHVRHGSGTAY